MMAVSALLIGVRQSVRNYAAVRSGSSPGHIFFQKELQWLLQRDDDWLQATASEYRAHYAAWRHLSGLRSASRSTDGVAKTLDVAEGFALWALVKHLRPRVVVELGTQLGISARLWKEALNTYVPEHELIMCDLDDRLRFIGKHECTFLKGDARQTLSRVFETRKVDVLHNDAHPYDLIHWSLDEGLRHGVPVFTFHDVGQKHPRGPFKVASADLTTAEKIAHGEEYGRFGTWERHLMAEVFSRDVLHHDTVAQGATRIGIFDSLFGFGVVIRGDAICPA